MSINPSFSFDLYPGLDEELQAAYERNIAGSNASPDAIAAGGLAAAVSAQMPNRLPGALGGNVLPGFTDVIQSAIDQADALFGMDGRNGGAPSLESGALDHTDWEKLSTAHATMESLGLEPEVVVYPTGLNADAWKSMYGALPNTQNGGLYINEDIKAVWDELGFASQDSKWQVQVLPGNAKPTLLDISHDMTKSADGSLARLAEVFADGLNIRGIDNMRDHYPTLPAYLTLQALRLRNGQPPIDSDTYTWLQGTFDNNTKAPFARWYPDDGRVSVLWDGPGDQHGTVGVRPAVRGVEL